MHRRSHIVKGFLPALWQYANSVTDFVGILQWNPTLVRIWTRWFLFGIPGTVAMAIDPGIQIHNSHTLSCLGVGIPRKAFFLSLKFNVSGLFTASPKPTQGTCTHRYVGNLGIALSLFHFWLLTIKPKDRKMSSLGSRPQKIIIKPLGKNSPNTITLNVKC